MEGREGVNKRGVKVTASLDFHRARRLSLGNDVKSVDGEPYLFFQKVSWAKLSPRTSVAMYPSRRAHVSIVYTLDPESMPMCRMMSYFGFEGVVVVVGRGFVFFSLLSLLSSLL